MQKMGFELRFERELDECARGEHDCEQRCLNTVGGFSCDCFDGFSLRPDGRTCESELFFCLNHLRTSRHMRRSSSRP